MIFGNFCDWFFLYLLIGNCKIWSRCHQQILEQHGNIALKWSTLIGQNKSHDLQQPIECFKICLWRRLVVDYLVTFCDVRHFPFRLSSGNNNNNLCHPFPLFLCTYFRCQSKLIILKWNLFHVWLMAKTSIYEFLGT